MLFTKSRGVRGVFKKFPDMKILQSSHVSFKFETDYISKRQSFGEFCFNKFKNENTIEC